MPETQGQHSKGRVGLPTPAGPDSHAAIHHERLAKKLGSMAVAAACASDTGQFAQSFTDHDLTDLHTISRSLDDRNLCSGSVATSKNSFDGGHYFCSASMAPIFLCEMYRFPKSKTGARQGHLTSRKRGTVHTPTWCTNIVLDQLSHETAIGWLATQVFGLAGPQLARGCIFEARTLRAALSTDLQAIP